MTDGLSAWADDVDREYYKENHDKHTKEVEDYLKSQEFRRLVELRIKYKELKELENLERIVHNMQCSYYRTVNHALTSKMNEGK